MSIPFPAGIYLDRETAFRYSSPVRSTERGGHLQKNKFSDTTRTRIDCRLSGLIESEKNTLVNFLIDNDSATDITWTIDSIDWIGGFVGDFHVSMQGSLFTVRMNYSAKRV